MRLAPDFGIVRYTDRWPYRLGEDVKLYLSAREAGDVAIRLHGFRELIPDGLRLDIITERPEGIDLSAASNRKRL